MPHLRCQLADLAPLGLQLLLFEFQLPLGLQVLQI